MDLGYVVIAIVAAVVFLAIRSFRGRWNRKRDDYRHNPLPGHRLEGSDHTGGGPD